VNDLTRPTISLRLEAVNDEGCVPCQESAYQPQRFSRVPGPEHREKEFGCSRRLTD